MERERWRLVEKARQEAENKQIEEYAKMKQEREEERQEVKKHKEEEKNLIYDRVCGRGSVARGHTVIFTCGISLQPKWNDRNAPKRNWRTFVLRFTRKSGRKSLGDEIR